MAAQVRIGRISASVISANAARVRIGRILATVQRPVATVAHVRIGRIAAAVTPSSTTPSAGLIRRNGAWAAVTPPRIRKAGAWVTVTPRVRRGSAWQPLNPVPPSTGGVVIPARTGFSLVSADNFSTLDTAAWSPYDNSTYGSDGGRIQRYMARNLVVGPGSAGATGGTSLKMLSKREAVGGNAFTAGMLDSQTVGRYHPRYCCAEVRVKMPHGQGLWPAWWFTAKNGGAATVEIDWLEYFHSQIPGRTESTLHRSPNTGPPAQLNVSKANAFFEEPTLTPGWQIIRGEVTPVTDATGATPADPSKPSNFVRFKAFLNGVKYWDYVDTQALYWTTNGGDPDSFYNVYLQGCEIDGKFVGSPDGPLGYSHILNACLVGGTAPNACTTVVSGHAMRLPTFGDPSSTFEIDYHRVWKYTG